MTRTKIFPGFPWDIMVLCAFFLYVATIVLKYKQLDITLGDTDDAMRLVQLREYMNHGDWFNLHTQRVGGADGYTSHWSRIPDAIMALLFMSIQPFTSVEFAEKAVRAIYPGIWVMLAFAALTLWAFKQNGNRHNVILMLLLLVTNPASLVQFLSGRIDHHNAQIALTVMVIVFAALQRVDWRFAIASGASMGLMLTIGLESIPFAVVAAGAVAANFAFFDDGQKAAKGFAAALVISTLLGYVISFTPSHYLQTACDALGFNLLVAVVGGGGVLFFWANSSNLSASLKLRLGGLVTAGLVALGFYVAGDTACLGGPFGHVDPAIKPIWLNRVREMQPIFGQKSFAENLESAPLIYVLVLAFASVAVLLNNAKNRKDFAFLVMLFGFLTSIPLGLMNLRMSLYIVWLSTPFVCLAIVYLMQILPLKKLLAAFAVIVAFSPYAMFFWVNELASFFMPRVVTTNVDALSCAPTENYAALKTLPEGLVLAELDLGPYVLAHTHHSVVAAPYHRMSASILQVMNFYNTEAITEAREIVLATGAKYLLICNPDATGKDKADSKTMKAELLSGNVPNWLEAVKMSNKSPLVIFKVTDQISTAP